MIPHCTLPLLTPTNPYPSLPLLTPGFRIDPLEKLEETFKELKKLHDVYSTCPVFGVEFVFEKMSPSTDQLLQVNMATLERII